MIDVCKLTYDWGLEGDPPAAGHYLRGQGVRGPSPRAYRILTSRLVKSTVYPGRYALTCERLKAVDIPDDAIVRPIYWYSRTKKRPQRLIEGDQQRRCRPRWI